MKEFLQEKWDEILEFLKSEYEITRVSLDTWVKPLQVASVSPSEVILYTEDPQMNLDFINKRYQGFVRTAILEIADKNDEYKDYLHSDYELIITRLTNGETKESNTAELKTADIRSNSLRTKYNNLDPRYTFENFVVSNNNSLAHAASLAVAEAPAEVYNPLYIYGGVGLGKTHLMHSIAHFIIDNNPSLNVMYVTSEQFTNELIESIRIGSNNQSDFREKYRKVDVLLIDDIQFIIGKERTQEEFFYTFNDLYAAKKQIVISSDKPPKDLATLEDRLRSRFEWGLIVDMQIPDFETRMAILRKKQEFNNSHISDEIIRYIALNVKSNVRELEGALTKVVAMAKLQHREITISLAEEALADIIAPNRNKVITCTNIIEIVAEHFGITAQDIYSQDRSRKISNPRQIVMYLCSKLTNENNTSIGKILNNRDHTTVMHGIRTIEDELIHNAQLQTTMEILKKKINPQ